MTNLEIIKSRIKEANDAYWKSNKPIISDTEYDKLVETLRKLSPNDPLLDELGSETLGEDKVTHAKPMLSLAKFYDFSDIVTWCASVARSDNEVFMVSPKYDGISLEFANNIISTRGKKGLVGNDITHLASHIGIISRFELDDDKVWNDGINLQEYIDHDDDIYGSASMRGELLVSHRMFQRLQHNYPELFADYKTCRNLAAGFANSKADSEIAELNRVHIADFVSHRAFEIPVTLKELKAGRNVVAEVMQFINRPDVDYPVDGVVLRLADDAYGETLGVTAHHPRSAIAYKFTSETEQVVLKEVEWGIGEENISPVAIFAPVQIDGVMVKRATLHNPQWMEDHQIMIGSTLTIERRGGVIPKVIDVSNPSGKPYVSVVPKVCPSCGHPVKSVGKFIKCTNDKCPGKLANKIIRGLNVFGIKGVGPALADAVVKTMHINDIMEFATRFKTLDDAKLHQLSEMFNKDQVSALIKINSVMAGGVTAEQLLASVCIPKCSTEFVTTVERDCGGIVDLVNAVPVDMMYDKIVDHCNISAVTNFMIWMENNRERFLEYMQLFKIVQPVRVDSAAVKGVLCFTGSGPQPRKDLQALAMTKGYRCTENVNACTALVCEDPNGSSSKLRRAKAKGIQLMGYNEFLSLMNQA